MDALERFGVFLRPDPATCLAITTVTGQLRAQYGLLSAGAFPPHATLAGSLPIAASAEDLAEALTGGLMGFSSFPVLNSGVHSLWGGIVYDIHEVDGAPNEPLVHLAATVDAAVRPVLGPASGLVPDIYLPETWHAHLSLASHELHDRPELRGEVEEYIHGLHTPYPSDFIADTVMLYRFTDPSWTGSWWRTMRWEHLHTWRLASP
jgi:hypothetical protein